METSKSLVSVVIPAYNAANFIEETIDSILGQTYQKIEIIVVDDGSVDDTASVVKGYGDRVRYIYQENSGGCSSPRNNGLKHASGEFITFFDADDIMMADKIEMQVESLLESKHDISICNYQNFKGDEVYEDHFSSCPELLQSISKSGQKAHYMDKISVRSLLLRENFSSACSPLFRKNLIEEIKGYDEGLKACEDFHMNFRAARYSDVTILEAPLFRRRLHDSNMSSNEEKMLENYIKSRSSLLDSETDNVCKMNLKRCLADYYSSMIYCQGKQGHLRKYVYYLASFLRYSFYSRISYLKLIAAGAKALLLDKRAP